MRQNKSKLALLPLTLTLLCSGPAWGKKVSGTQWDDPRDRDETEAEYCPKECNKNAADVGLENDLVRARSAVRDVLGTTDPSQARDNDAVH